jgi:predicted  nucleic acid-binding Zn-ribbon protein
MPSQCPQCGAALKDDYGMTQCPGCGVFAFVDMDGNAVINKAGDSDTESDSDSDKENLDLDAAVPAPGISFENPVAEPAYEPIDFQMGIVDDQAPEAAPDLAPPPTYSEEAMQIAPDLSPDLGPADDPLGLSDFANSEISSGKDGPYLFRILILGIDTKELRESIREALEDSRFGWDPDAILGRIDKGKLTIENLAPIKATIVIQRLRHLPVKIRWEQYAISQIEPS